MNAGILNEIIEIRRAVIVRNEYGEETITFRDYLPKVRASVQFLAEQRRVEGTNEVVWPAGCVVKLRIHYQDKVKDTDRVVWKGQQYRITSIEPSRALQQLTIRVEKVEE